MLNGQNKLNVIFKTVMKIIVGQIDGKRWSEEWGERGEGSSILCICKNSIKSENLEQGHRYRKGRGGGNYQNIFYRNFDISKILITILSRYGPRQR